MTSPRPRSTLSARSVSAPAPLAEPIERGSVTMRDGSRLGWTAWGSPNGVPVLSEPHLGESGDQLSRDEVRALIEANVRLIAVARPGLGDSTPRPKRTVIDDANDLRDLADEFGLSAVRVLGTCAGAGPALAFAATQPDRVSALVLVSPFAPLRGPSADSYLTGPMRGLALTLRIGLLARRWARQYCDRVQRDPDAILDAAIERMTPEDAAIAALPEHRALQRRAFVEFTRSPDRVLGEYRTLSRPWPFDLTDVRVPVRIWHGALDTTVPVAMTEWLVRTLPNATSDSAPTGGHVMAPARTREIVRALLTN